METFTSFTDKEQFHEELLQLSENTTFSYKRFNKLFHENLHLVDKTSYHFISELLNHKTNEKTKAVLFQLILQSIYQAEYVSGNSAYLSFLFSLNFLKNLIKNKHDFEKINEVELKNKFEQAWNKFKTSIENINNVSTEEFIKNQIDSLCEQNEILSETVWKAISVAGLEGKLFLEQGKNKNFIVEQKEGYSFDLEVFDILFNKVFSWQRNQVKVFIVDGIIEQVSEIDHLLTKAQQTRQPLLLVAQGFSEEIIATCKINNEQRNFDVFPVKIKTHAFSVNQVNDISVVCGTTPISFLTGQMLSCVKWEELPTVQTVICNKKETIFENDSTKSAVQTHIKYLINKKQTEDLVEDVQAIIDKRIKSLVSNSVIIHLPDVSDVETNSTKIKIDLCLRNVKTLLNYGFVKTKDILCEIEKLKKDTENEDFSHKQTIDKIFFDSLKESFERNFKEKDKIPTLSAIIGILLTGKIVLTLVSASCFIGQNNNNVIV